MDFWYLNIKNNIRLKSLIGISFLIFFLPFLQTCSDREIKKYKCIEETQFSTDSVNIEDNVKQVHTKIGNNLKNDDFSQQIECIERGRKENTFNLYYLGFKGYNEFEIRYLLDKTFYIFFCFTLIVILTFIILILSFVQKFKMIIILSGITLLLLFTGTSLLYFVTLIEDISQIKYGYYLFVINSILIIFESRKELKILTQNQKLQPTVRF